MSSLSLFDPTIDLGAVTVSQLNQAVKAVVEGELGPLWVLGEVCSFKAYSSGHWYFTLRDETSQVRCCMWKSNAAKAGRPPMDGTRVFALCTPSLWEEKGEFRLTVQKILATSEMGSAAQEFERVKRALAADGLFELSRKRPLPEFPTTIAVVTSVDGAALRDVITVTRSRWPLARLLVVGTRVQGDGAPGEIVRALGIVDRLDGVDLCIVGRGGGAREDLAAFNDEAVCRALARVRVPTVSAVGHETDVSLCDLVADLRAATPSAAAELATPDLADLLGRLDGLAARLAGGLTRRTRLAAERLDRSADRMQLAVESIAERRRAVLDRLAAQLDALSPLKVLGRGYAMPTAGGRVLKRRADFAPGLVFDLHVSDGDVRARVVPSTEPTSPE